MSKITTELLLERAVPRSTRLRKIETLNLSKLQLKTGDLDPRLFSRLRHLQKLDLSDNLLDKFPNSLTLPDLRVLNCNNNKLEDVTALKQFPLLEELTYENNVYLTLNDDYKVIFLLQNLRLLNGKDITKLANHVRRVNSRKLTSKVTAHWKKFFHDQLPEKYTAEQVKSIKKKFLKSVQTNVVYGPSSLSEFTRWRVKMIAEEFLANSLGLELNSDTEPEEKTDENEEESTESPREGRRSSLSGVCYLTMGLLVLLLGLVFASMYVYRYFFITQLPRESVFHCGVLYEDSLYSPFKGQLELHEDVKIYIEENYEQINVPVPQFGGSDPADIIHDFQRGLTAYHDITLDKCYVIELNTTIVMPPRNLWELLVNVKKGTYLPQTYIIQEEMIATEHVSDMEQLGSFIYRLCSGKETYRLRRRGARRRISRREAGNCHRIRHFENTFVVETVICQKS